MKTKNRIRIWLPFSDNEISVFQFYFRKYVQENIDSLSKEDIYDLAILSTETQYQMRVLKERITNRDKVNYDTNSNNIFVKRINDYPNLIEFVKEEVIKGYENLDPIERYKLDKQAYYSYFTSEPNIIKKIEEEIKFITIK